MASIAKSQQRNTCDKLLREAFGTSKVLGAEEFRKFVTKAQEVLNKGRLEYYLEHSKRKLAADCKDIAFKALKLHLDQKYFAKSTAPSSSPNRSLVRPQHQMKRRA